MKRTKSVFAVCALALSLALAFGMPAFADEGDAAVLPSVETELSDESEDPVIEPGWYEQDGKRYYVLNDGSYVRGWLKIGSSWYWFDSDGVMVFGGWRKIGSFWYWFEEDGTCFTDGWRQIGSDWYCFNEDGICVTNAWRQHDSTWYYFGSDGKLRHDCFISYNGSYYYLGSDGSVTVGWIDYDGKFYYAGSDGKIYYDRSLADSTGVYWFSAAGYVETGWFKYGGSWYYAESDGKLCKNRWVSYGGKAFFLGSSYRVLADTYIQYKGGYYVLRSDGSMALGWVNVGNDWYYAESDGKLARNTPVLYNGKVYYFGDDCKLTTNIGWVFYGDNWYFRLSSGDYAKGWAKIAGSWHYFDENYASCFGLVEVDGNWYWFDATGRVLASEWVRYDGNWYHFDANGSADTGWSYIDGAYYYFNENGILVQGSWVANDLIYYRADANGAVTSSSASVRVQERSVATPEGLVKGYYISSGLASAPTLIFSHGLGASGVNFMSDALELATLGVNTYLFDFVGGSTRSASGGDFSEMTVWTEAEQLDAILTEVLNWGDVDASRVYLAGHSQGGLVSTMVASAREEEAGLVLLAPAFNLGEIVRDICASYDEMPETITFVTVELGRTYIWGIWDVYEDKVLAGYSGSSIIFHGKNDTVIVSDVSVRAKEAWGDACALRLLNNTTHYSIVQLNPYIVKSTYIYVTN